jgi:hypothetical protein
VLQGLHPCWVGACQQIADDLLTNNKRADRGQMVTDGKLTNGSQRHRNTVLSDA